MLLLYLKVYKQPHAPRKQPGFDGHARRDWGPFDTPESVVVQERLGVARCDTCILITVVGTL